MTDIYFVPFKDFVLEVLVSPNENIKRNVHDANYAKYWVKKFVVRKIHNINKVLLIESIQLLNIHNFDIKNIIPIIMTYFESDSTVFIEHRVYYKDCDWEGWVSDESYNAAIRVKINNLPVEKITDDHYGEISDKLILDAKRNSNAYSGFNYGINSFICYKTLDAALNAYKRTFDFPHNIYSNDGRLNHIDCFCWEIPVCCAIM